MKRPGLWEKGVFGREEKLVHCENVDWYREEPFRIKIDDWKNVCDFVM